MRAASLKSKAYAVPVVAIAGLSVVGTGLVSDGVVKADTTSVTDTINVTVQPSCTFNSAEDKTYTGSAVNGAEVDNFNDSGTHTFNIFCNDHSGFTVSATPSNLTATGISANIAYTATYAASGTDSLWTANITSSTTGLTVVPVVPVGGGTIITSSTNTPAAGVSFTATYSAYVGSVTPAGTYTGTIVYTLAPTGSTNSGSGSQQNSGSDDSGTGGSQEPGGTSGGSEQGGSGDSGNAGTNSIVPDTNALNLTPSTTTLNNDYSTHNTYITTNYGSGSATPAVSNPAPVVATNTGSGESTNNNENSSTDSSYEKPLGVTTAAKASSNKESEIDPAPFVVAGVLVTAGLAGVALVKNGSKEEN